MLKRQCEETGSEAVDGDVFPRRVLAGSILSLPFLSGAFLLHPSALVGGGMGWRQLIHQGPRSSLLSARGSIGARRNAFCCHFIADSVLL